VVPDPGQPVTVSVGAADRDGVAAMTLWYSVNGGRWQNTPLNAETRNPMSEKSPKSGVQNSAGAAGNVRASGFGFLSEFGIRNSDYAATIPGQPAASIVQFYVEGVDTLGAAATFPAHGTNSRALYAVQDGQAAPPPLHNLRIFMTPADAAFMHTGTNTLSNELLRGTVVYELPREISAGQIKQASGTAISQGEQDVFYDVGVRLKGSFVGRNVARVGFHIAFDPARPFRGVHEVLSVDRSQHTLPGGVGEIVVKHIANHAGGIPSMHEDLAHCIAPLSSYTGRCTLQFSRFDDDYLDAQFKNGSDGSMFEVEVLRWNVATIDGNPESPKRVGNESGGTGFANLEVQDYGDNKESYRWMFLLVNNRSSDDYTQAIKFAKTFSLTGTNFDAQARHALELDEWLRVMAYQELMGPGDVYYTDNNIHNFRIYVRPEDQKVLYLPWDWDSSFLRSPTAPIIGFGNIAKLVNNPHHLRLYLNHMFDLITTTFNTTYLSRWTAHYGAVSGQDLSSILSYIRARAQFALSQLPTATAFAIRNNNGTNFSTNTPIITLTGTAPIAVKTIAVNGTAYPIIWTSSTNWTMTVPLLSATNLLVVQGIDNYGRHLTNALDTITVTNTGAMAPLPVVINEWMANNAGPLGHADPLDGLFQDWLELFNPNSIAINLSGYYLTDDLSQPTKWRIPTNTLIAPRGFLLVWADNQTDQNALGTNGHLHAGFQLNTDGEAIRLFAPDGTPQHTLVFGAQLQNVSQGLFPDGHTNAVCLMTNYTPGAANTLAGPLRITDISFDGVKVRLTWTAIPGHTYEVQFKDDLTASVWEPLGGEVRAVAETASATAEVGANANRFYRVKRVKQ
jgi:hypothetical protein